MLYSAYQVFPPDTKRNVTAFIVWWYLKCLPPSKSPQSSIMAFLITWYYSPILYEFSHRNLYNALRELTPRRESRVPNRWVIITQHYTLKRTAATLHTPVLSETRDSTHTSTLAGTPLMVCPGQCEKKYVKKFFIQ